MFRTEALAELVGIFAEELAKLVDGGADEHRAFVADLDQRSDDLGAKLGTARADLANGHDRLNPHRDRLGMPEIELVSGRVRIPARRSERSVKELAKGHDGGGVTELA